MIALLAELLARPGQSGRAIDGWIWVSLIPLVLSVILPLVGRAIEEHDKAAEQKRGEELAGEQDQGRSPELWYLSQVRGIAPGELIGRGSELSEWASFCAGFEPYAWWQAEPWAGKTALASWFVLHPPTRVDVVSFFVTGGLAGQSDSEAFLRAMIEQLSVLVPVGEAFTPVAATWADTWLNLLHVVAAQSARQGRRLVVVVDGLDEDFAGAAPGPGRASIASMLPRRPPPGARFILTSRPDPGVPDDVPDGHPLRSCRPRPLSASPAAKGAERLARRELMVLLDGDQVGIDVVGYLVASGGGLTSRDLCELTEAVPHQVETVLRGVSGRSLVTRASPDPRTSPALPDTRVYLLGHETLRRKAEQQLGHALARYRQKIHEWMRSFARDGWPDTTPGYAIHGYPGMLTVDNDLTRLSLLARDRHRLAFLLRSTGNDYAALTELGTALQLAADHQPPDMRALVEMAARRYVLVFQNRSVPPRLAACWARLGRADHAETLARSSSAPGGALTEVAIAIAQGGNHDRAETLARGIPDRYWHARAITEVAAAIAKAGDYERAEALARGIGDDRDQSQALSEVAVAIAQGGDYDRAEALARDITESSQRVLTISDVATVIALTGDHDRARRLANIARQTLTFASTRHEGKAAQLARVAIAFAKAGDRDLAGELAAKAQALTRTIKHWELRTAAVTAVAVAIAQAGDYDGAEAFARTIDLLDYKERALADLARVIAQAGDYDRAEALARGMPDRYWPDIHWHARAVAEVAVAVAKAGDYERAEALARGIAYDYDQSQALSEVAAAIAKAGGHDRAEALARSITFTVLAPVGKIKVLADVAMEIAQAGALDHARRLAAEAEGLARGLIWGAADERLVPRLVEAIARTGDHDHAEEFARAITRSNAQHQALANLALVIAQAGDYDRAEELARGIGPAGHAVADVATAMAQTGQFDRAEALARTIDFDVIKAKTLADLAAIAVQAGEHDRAHRLLIAAEILTDSITDGYSRPEVLTSLAVSTAKAGDREHAEALVRGITYASDRFPAFAALAIALAQAGDLEHACRLAAEAEALARTDYDSDDGTDGLAKVSAAIGLLGDLEGAAAEALAVRLSDPRDQVTVIAGAASEAAQMKMYDRARHLAAAAEALADKIRDPAHRGDAFCAVATAIAQAGDDAKPLLARALAMGTPPDRWVTTVSRYYASEIGDAWKVLTGMYMSSGAL